MSKIWIIIKREYWTRVRKKSFILSTLLAPFAFALFILAVAGIENFSEGNKTIGIVDNSGQFENLRLPDLDKKVYFKYLDLDEEAIVAEVEGETEFDAIVVIEPVQDIKDVKNVRLSYFATERLGMSATTYIEQQLAKKLEEVKMAEFGLDRDKIKAMQVDVRLSHFSPESGEEVEGFSMAASIIGFVVGLAIYISLLVYGTMIMKGVMEEKTNRIVEVLTSSVKPFQLLVAKIVGIGAVGITQYILWGILIFITNLVLMAVVGGSGMEGMGSGAQMNGNEVAPEDIELIIAGLQQLSFIKIMGTFLFYFVGGFLLYGALFAAIGSAVNDDGDMQSLTFPVTVPIIISFFIAMSTLENPNGPLAVWGSIIPLSSPIVMPTRIFYDLPAWQIILSVVFLIIGFLSTVWLAARIYRTGILMYGKKVTVKEVAKWIFRSGA